MAKGIQREWYTKFLLLFIIFQPLFDILTYISIRTFDSNLTIGIVVRVVMMVISLWFILFANSSKFKKHTISYLLVLGSILTIGLVNNYVAKPIFDPFTEIQFIAKTVYFPIMLCSYLLLFTDTGTFFKERTRILKAISIAMFIVSLSIFIAILTGTSSDTYEWNKFGYKGWFFSGNELGSIVAISFPLVYLYTLKKVDQARKSVYFLPTLMLASVSILIGTKVGYFAVLGSVFIVFINYLTVWFIQSIKKVKEPLLKLRTGVSFAFLLLLLIVTPFSPAFTNVAGDVGQISESGQEDDPTGSESNENGENEDGLSSENVNIIESPILRIILSSRNVYFSKIYNMYQEAGPLQKLFGMGYAGNYEDDHKLIEMDFFDLFFSFGIFGTILLFMPFAVILVFFIQLLFKVPGELLRPENLLNVLSISFGVGIAFVAGHVLYAPAVSIYLAISMVLLFMNMYRLNPKNPST